MAGLLLQQLQRQSQQQQIQQLSWPQLLHRRPANLLAPQSAPASMLPQLTGQMLHMQFSWGLLQQLRHQQQLQHAVGALDAG